MTTYFSLISKSLDLNGNLGINPDIISILFLHFIKFLSNSSKSPPFEESKNILMKKQFLLNKINLKNY